MGLLPSSPRRRRRVLALGGAATVAVIVAAVFLLLPSNKPPNPVPTGKEGAALLAAKTSRHVSTADRKLIDQAFDHFLPNALNRKQAEVSWAWAGPDMRAGATHAQWLRGTMPVPQYPAAGSDFHGWRVLDATKTTVDYSILVHPRTGATVSDWVFQGELIKRNGRWLVDTIYTTAIMAKPHNGFQEVGPADFAAGASSKAEPSTHATLSRTWLSTLIGILVGALVLIPLGIGIGLLIRRRRWQGRVKAQGRTELPALPPSARTAEKRDRTPVG